MRPDLLKAQDAFDQTATSCSNIRYDLKCCSHIVLDRCKVHALDETLSCTCPDPYAGFAVVVIDRCRHCELKSLQQSHAELVDTLSKRRDNLLAARALWAAKREKVRGRNLPIHERAKVMCNVAVHIKKVEERLTSVKDRMEKLEIDMREWYKAFEMVGVDVEEMDIIGSVIEDEWVMWCTGEQNESLWKTGWNEE